jgi:hypothetical protein
MFTLLIGLLLVSNSDLTIASSYSDTVSADTVSAAVSYSPTGSVLTTPADNDGEDEAREKAAYHIPVVLNDSVEAYIESFKTSGKIMFQQWLDSSARYLDLMQEIFRNENLPEELVYVAMIESGFDPGAISRAKAAGPWQFMPGTARSYGLRSDWWVDERKDHIKSTRAAARLFRDLHSKLGSWPLALAAYNAGMGKVRRAMLKTDSEDFWDLKESAHLRRETKGFVPKFMAASLIARDPAAYGFQIPEVEPLRYDEVAIWESVDLNFVAYCTGSTYQTIKSLNPEINGKSTPPNISPYLLKIPEGKSKTFLARSTAFRSAALPIPWEEKVYRSLLHQTDSAREARNGPVTCSPFETTETFAGRTERPVERINNALNMYLAFSGKGGRMMKENPLMACSSRTRLAGVNQQVESLVSPVFSNTADRRR